MSDKFGKSFQEKLTKVNNFIELLRYRALQQPNRRAYTFLADGETQRSSWTYGELDQKARAIAAYLQSMNAAGERALLLYPPGLEFIAAFFGCLYAGVVAVPAYPPKRDRKMSRLEAIATNAKAKLTLTTASLLTDIEARFAGESGLTGLQAIATDTIASDRASDWQKPTIDSETLTFLQYTSGSTGTPKGVMVSHRNLLYNSESIKQAFELTPESVSVTWLPSFHDMGLIDGIIQPLYTGFLGVVMSPVAFLGKPIRWLQAISHYQATHSGGPNFAYDLCINKITREQCKTLDLSSWHSAYSGAEPVRWNTLNRFTQMFKACGFRSRFFYPCYGMAEATLMVSGGDVNSEPVSLVVEADALEQNQIVEASNKNGKPLVGCGRARLDAKIAIADPETLTECASDRVGEIWVSGTSVARGYWQRPEQTKETFQAYLADSGEGPFLRTGDLGFIKDGELFITGRLKDLIIIRGRNYYPQDIELTVEQSHQALRKNCSAAFTLEIDNQERLIIVQEVERTYLRKLNVTEIAEAIRNAVSQEHELRPHAILLLKTASIPKTSSGKIQRSACRKGFLAKTLNVVGEWSAAPENRIEFQRLDAEVNSLLQTLQPQVSVGSRPRNESIDKLQNWIGTWLINKLNIPPDSVNFSKSFADYGVDSVMAVELAEDLKVKLKLPQSLEPTLAWNFPTIEALSEYLVSRETATSQENAGQESTLEKDLTNKAIKSDEPIAIIGLGCRFPGGANSPENYWQNLRDGVDAISPIPSTRWDIDIYYDRDSDRPGKMYARAGGFIDDVDKFDPYFFEISPREAIGTDPQHRLLLEVSYSALENAGLAPESLKGSRTGVFVGISFDDYSRLTLNSGDSTRIDAHSSLGNTRSIAAGRLSYALDLQGPSLQLDTACSSSLLTVHLACQSLRSGECNVALAGGVNLILSPETTISLCKLKALSVQGACKTFDASADGYVRGEGCGIVVLKRLSDAIASNDNILAVIRGSAVNHDGRSNGLTAPNGSAQESLIRQALINANVKPRDIQYVEAHGTGTALGDPIEVLALDKVLGEGRTSETPLIIGSVKTNIGHLESAAGIASLIKVVLSLQHERIPPHLHLTNPNPYIPWGKLSIKVPQTLTPWQDAEGCRVAGVSSFGMSGTNVHLIVENAPEKQVRQTSVERPVRILTLSAKTESALQLVASNYTKFLSYSPDLSMADVCFTSNMGRSHFNHRAAFIFASKTELDRQLEAFTSEKEIPGLLKGKTINKRSKLAFLFTGQGSQYTGMGRQLYETSPTFRNTLDRCSEILQSYLETPLLEVLYPENPESSAAKLLHETVYTQPALFALEYSLYRLWKSWGIEPDIVMGHSVGEYVAACVAGVFSLEDGLRLIAERGRLMQSLPDNGEMVSVLASAERVSVAIKPYERDVAIAAINGPQSTVISGEKQGIKAIRTSLEAEGIKTKQLPVSHAFHSPLVTPILKDFERIAAGIKYLSPQIDIISNVTGKLVSEEIARPEYWVRHIQQPVRFSTSMETLAQQGSELFVEMGPNPLLLGMGRQCIDTGNWLPSLRNGRSDWQQILESLGELYVKGLSIDWLGFDRDYSRQRLQLPTYPFERSRYWVASNSPLAATSLLPAELTEVETVNSVAMQLAAEENLSETEAKLLPKILTMLYNRERQNELKFSKIELPENGIFYSSWKAPKERKTNGEYHIQSRLENAPEVERLQILISHIQQSVATVLEIDINRAPAPDVGFFNMGMDSLMAVELQKRLEKSLGVSLSSTLAFNYPTIETLGKYLLEEKLLLIREDKTSKLIEEQADNYLQEIASRLERLTETDVEALLLRKLQTI